MLCSAEMRALLPLLLQSNKRNEVEGKRKVGMSGGCQILDWKGQESCLEGKADIKKALQQGCAERCPACSRGYPSVGAGGSPWLPHTPGPGREPGLWTLPRISRCCCWSPRFLLRKEIPQVWGICMFFTSNFSRSWRLSPAGREEDAAPPSHVAVLPPLSPLPDCMCPLHPPETFLIPLP